MVKLKSFWSEILVVTVLLILAFITFNPSDDYYRTAVVRSDGKGYFAYLPAIIAHQDLNWEASRKDEATLIYSSSQHYLHKSQNEALFNKYYPGLALLQVPFYAMGYFLECVFFSGNSYGLFPVLFFHLGSIFYGLLGFILLKAFLRKVFKNRQYITFVSLVLFFGSNLFFQPVFHPGFSHHYSFAMMCLFALLTRIYFEKSNRKNAFLLGLALGLIFLVRPTNGLIVFAIPFFLVSWQNTVSFIKNIFRLRNLHLLSATTGFSISIGILLVINYLQTGNLFNWSYQGEGFNFDSPELWNTLFSFRTGLFVHIPMLFISLFGFYFAFKKGNKFVPFAWLLYFSMVLYLTASWWCWDYGGSWGHRVFTEQMIIFAMPLVYLLQGTSRPKLVQGICIVFSLLFCFKLYQIRHGLSPRRLTAKMYFQTFLNLRKPDGVTEYHYVKNCPPYGELIRTHKLKLKESINVVFNDMKEYGCDTKFTYPKDRGIHRFLVKVKAVKELAPGNDWSGVNFVFDGITEDGSRINYFAMPFYEFYKEGLDGKKVLELSREIIDVQQEQVKVSLYIWNKAKRNFKLEDIEVVVEEYGVIKQVAS